MQIDTLNYDDAQWNLIKNGMTDRAAADLVLVFGDTDVFKEAVAYHSLRELYPNACIMGASSSGNILGAQISTSALIATAVKFNGIRVELKTRDVIGDEDVESLTESLVSELSKENLKHVFVLNDGLLINGSAVIRGLNKGLEGITASGGMAGDGGRFQETWIIADEVAKQRRIAVLGFYGNAYIRTGCFAGWSEFGAERIITKSQENILFELDGEPALDLYKKYLGEYAKDLPASGLRFPLSIKENLEDQEVIRTLLAIDEESKAIIFAGDVPQGYHARLMKPDLDVLIDGAEMAAAAIEQPEVKEGLAIIVSCVGRKLIMGQIVDEELEAVQDVLGQGVQLSGFYSYGEIAPFSGDLSTCQLHNQTMTLTAIYEVCDA